MKNLSTVQQCFNQMTFVMFELTRIFQTEVPFKLVYEMFAELLKKNKKRDSKMSQNGKTYRSEETR